MSERSKSRSRSRSPGRNGDNSAPPANGAYQENGGGSASGGGGGDQNYGTNADAGDREEVKLYVGNLDYDTNEDSLRQEFGNFGEVTDVFLPMERGTQRPRGFGFVTLASRAAAEKAIAEMDQRELHGRTIRVNESKPRGEGPADQGRGFGPGGRGGFNASGRPEVKLYVGNLSFDTTQETVQELFEKHGGVTDCFLPTDRETGKVRGFAFVSMAAEHAEKACDEVNGMEVDGRALRVNEAQPKGAGGGGGPPRGGGGYGGGGGYQDGGGYGGYNDGGYGGGGGGGYRDDRGGYGGGGYGGGYDDRGGYGGGGGGGGYGGGPGGGYNDRGGYGGGPGGGYGGGPGGGYGHGDRSGYGQGDRGGYGGGPGGGGGYGGGGYDDRGRGGGGGGYDNRY